MSPLRKILLILIGLGLIWVAVVAATRYIPLTKPLCKDCNVILISIDTLGAKHTSMPGSLDTTPFLKEFAATRAVVFTEAYAQAPWTLPSHTAMFTGRYPWEVGIMEAGDALPSRVVTIAEVLRDSGYTTHAFSNGAFVNPQWNMTQGFNSFSGSLFEKDWNDLPALFESGKFFIEQHVKDAQATPYLLLLRPFMVHDPYGDLADPASIDISDIVAANALTQTSTSKEAAQFREVYQTEVRLTDNALRDFIEELESSGALANTIIIITSDHGEEFGEHGTVGAHSASVHRENLWVPLIISVPGVSPRMVSATVETRSIPATIAELVGRPTKEFPAASLVPYIKGEATDDRVVLSQTALTRASFLEKIESIYRHPSFFETVVIPTERQSPIPDFTQSVIKGPWHLIRDQNGQTLLYDMEADPNETVNLLPKLDSLAPEAQRHIRELIGLLVAS